MIGYAARPKSAAAGRAPAVLVVHENRGLLEHVKDVCRRLATAGFVGVSLDLLSPQGGAETLSDSGAYSAELAKRPAADMVADLQAALRCAAGIADPGRQGTVGFCFGGGLVWQLLVAGTPLKAAVPFYGPAPQTVTALGSTKTAVFAVYAEQDTRITASAPQMEEQLKRSGTPYQITVYPGVNHAFHNDTNPPARYGAMQAQQAWVATIDWFRKYL
ncbi:MAG: dienelactone hydrolase family protein [Candidatus Limnocylindria bacterium]